MTFINLINQLKKQYPTNNQLVILTVIFSLSSKVKNKLDFTKFRHHQIDFSYDELIKKLDDYFLKHKPLGQIVHTTKFCKLTIDIYLHIFEPRSETELITDQIINYLKKHRDLKYGIDLCCGTGCIGLAIKKHCD
jgi:release factor glutamine methyltransferase